MWFVGVFLFKFPVRTSSNPLKLGLWWFDPDPGESSIRSRNIQIVRWKIYEYLEILGGLPMGVASAHYRSSSSLRCVLSAREIPAPK
ncbi:hypothetical protein F2Q70_00017675 [Brassica cretica]|uniref:Uncharacterized protein n=1 Tax=Brassica cretica TaxID=69181 RepID=A0A8S9I209_BRACR|nr:hypothetical protein F2Q70_00017675 [Brassica cretica]KAF2599006.1 hypothetical protein F2Q68_00010616 [Brassica cretica]